MPWDFKSTPPPIEIDQPAAKRLRLHITPPKPHDRKDRLGKLIDLAVHRLSNSNSWSDFITKSRGQSDIQVKNEVQHPAVPFLQQITASGVPVLQKTNKWTLEQRDAALKRGSHPSTHQHQDFIREEMASMVEQQYWTVIPYSQVRYLPSLRLSPMGVVPQRDRRPRIIVDYTFSGVNEDTALIAPMEAMQFGRAFNRVLHKIYHAPKQYGPVQLIKVDISDGFYRMKVADSSIPVLGVSFPTLPGEEPLVAFPLVLPMGWISSPPYFCALTETATDLANQSLRVSCTPPTKHPLSSIADNADNFQPTSRRIVPIPNMTAIAAHVQPILPPPKRRDHHPLSSSPHVAVSAAVSQPLSPLNHRFHRPSPVAYVDVYMDDFLGLAQGYPGLRERVRSTLLHSIDKIFRPLDLSDAGSPRKEPVSLSKLAKGDAKWSTRKCLLGWIIDTVSETIELPDHRVHRLLSLLTDLQGRKRVSLKQWQVALGELQSMVLALPGGRGLFSPLYTGLTQPLASTQKRIRITRPMHDALSDFHLLATDIGHRPTRLGEIVDQEPVAHGSADACGKGMGGIWLSAFPNFSPLLWRAPFPPCVQSSLVSTRNPQGTVSNSDLELAAQIAEQDVLVHQWDCRERTISTYTDNISARAWQRKGSKTTSGPTSYLLRLHSLHQRCHRYRSTIDYIPGPVNTMADDASRLWHLSDTAFLAHFNTCYPQHQPWQLLTLRPEMHLALTTALQCKRSKPESFLHDHGPEMLPGFSGPITAPLLVSTPCLPISPILSPSSKSLPHDTALAVSHPVVNLSGLEQWKQHSAPLARRWPAWGPLISA